ncbi:MAG: C39 family peptidase [Planctomycetia bacterium]|nr:C39 family peptidase [Planctomycetia bacterium]
MEGLLKLDILPQPDNVTCGPTCLHAVYRYYNRDVPLDELIPSIPQLDEGGTLAVLLGCDALKRGFNATIYTADLQVFDPTWFGPHGHPLSQRLRQQAAIKGSPRLKMTTEGYLDFLQRGGSIRMRDFTTALLRSYLKRGMPILTGVSATYLYGCSRENSATGEADDVRGEPAGHFVVLYGYHRASRSVMVADPLQSNPLGPEHYYQISADRVIRAILLGILTYDANMLVIEPRGTLKRSWHADADRRE